MKQKRKSILKLTISMLQVIAFICGVMLCVCSNSKVYAEGEEISYLYYDLDGTGITQQSGSCTNYTIIADQTAWGEAGQEKWYVLNGNVTIADRITVNGNVHLILVDGCTMTASKGIGVTSGNSLTIYAQSADESTMGALNAQLGKQAAHYYLAAIGGEGDQNSSGQIIINGGKITATGGTSAAGIGGGKGENGDITINGGFISATSQYNNATPGAAIGGGNNGNGTVTINGGHIVATGGQSAAGIGSGYAGSATVTINGGNIEAHGGMGAAGIGSGKYWNDTSTTRQATVIIHGGTVLADTKSPTQNTDGSAAIGGGAHSQGFVTIDGGHVTATAPKNCTCIGNYEVNYRQTGTVSITGGVVIAQLDSSVQASDNYYGIGGASSSVTLGWTNEGDSITAPAWGKRSNNSSTQNNGVTFIDGKSFQYQDNHTLAEAASLRNGATLIPFTPVAKQSVEQTDASGVRAWYCYTGSAIEPEPVVTYAGTPLTKGTDYTLSYTDDHTNLGEKTVTITGQGSYTGTKTISYQIVEASTTYLDDAGVSQTCMSFQCLDQSDTALSTGWYLVYDDLTINDRISLTGDVNLILKDGKTLTSVKGISVPSTASLTIYAQSNSKSTAGKLETGAPDVSYPGIGGLYQANTAVTPGNITIVGGVINASGGVGAAAIGGATYSPGGNITIKGGFVTAASSVGGGAAIGGGANADGGTITIYGGTVTATSNGGAGIGGGSGGKSGIINISGGTVTAVASGGAGIGGGSNGVGEIINITGGTITATNSGETGGAGIGGGINAAGGSITIQNATIVKATAIAGAGIGSGGGETAGTTTVIIGTDATITNAGSYNGAGIGSGQNSIADCFVTISDGANVKAGSTLGAGIGGGSGASNFSVKISDTDTIVNAWAGGIGTQDKNGHLSAYGGAAIGGGANTNGGMVEIEDGTVTAKAIGGGAGIGSGANTSTSDTTDGGSIRIHGGNVTATATHRAAGIGGGRRSNGGNITISGGTITANGSDAAGIGHGGEDTLWEGQGNFYVPIVTDPTQDVGGAWYDSLVPIEGTNKTTTDGTVTFTYADGGAVSITASSYPASVTMEKNYIYLDTLEEVNEQPITAEKTIIPNDTSAVYTVTFDGQGGSGDMVSVHVYKDASYTLPDCTFIAPKGKEFKEWSVKIGEDEVVYKHPNDTITVTADSTVTAMWQNITSPIFRNHSVVLGGQIGVNFYLELAEIEGYDYADSFMEFTLNGKTTQMELTSAPVDSKTGYRRFTCYLNSLQMADEIEAVFHYNNTETEANRYSVKTYVDYITSHESLYKPAEVALVKSIANYGHYTQPFIANYSEWTDGYNHETMPAAFEIDASAISTARAAVADKAIVKELEGSGLLEVQYSLSFGSETYINLYIKPNDGVTVQSVTCVDAKDVVKPVTTSQTGAYRKASINKINALDLGNLYTFTVNTSEGTATVKVYPMSYAYAFLNAEAYQDKTDVLQAMTALYQYYEATYNYVNAN